MGSSQKELIEFELNLEGQVGEISENQILKLMERGVLISLHVGYWRPYKKLKADDLGIQMNQEVKEYMKLGRKRLLPQGIVSELEKTEQRARDNLNSLSFKTFWGSFVPATAWRIWKEKNDQIRGEFYSIRDTIFKNLDNYKAQLRIIYSKAAEEAYKRLHPEVVIVPRDYIEEFVIQCLSNIPSKEEIFGSFRYETVYNYVPLSEYIRSMNGNKEKNQEIMSLEIAREMKLKKDQFLNEFLADIKHSIYALLIDAGSRIKESIAKNGKMVPRVKMGIENLIDKLKALNFLNDAEVDRIVAEMTTFVNMPHESRNANQFSSMVEDIRQAAVNQVNKIDELYPGRFEALELE